MRACAPEGKSQSSTAAATLRGFPLAGSRCMRKPGAAFTSHTPPRERSSGTVMSVVTTSMPITSRSTRWLRRSAISRMLGWTSSVTSVAVPPVLRFAVVLRRTTRPAMGTLSGVRPAFARRSTVASSTSMRVRTFSCPSPRRGSAFTASTSSRMVRTPSPTTCAGSRRAAATNWCPTTRRR